MDERNNRRHSWNDLRDTQMEFDSRHGWGVDPRDAGAVLKALRSDTIGLAGEVGEIANIVKRLQLDFDLAAERAENVIEEQRADIAEEIVDCSIYLMRIASYMGVDLEAEYLKKLSRNERRFKKYERD